MSELLETAKQHVADGHHKQAIDTLWLAEAQARWNLADARAFVEVATAGCDQTSGRLQKRYRELLVQGRDNFRPLTKAAQQQVAYRDAIAVVPRCRVLGGHGLPTRTGEALELIFAERELRLRNATLQETTISYDDVTAIEIGGRGATRSGGRFVGGGFGVEGAAEGMLVASALNLLTTRTSIDTVICVQTATAELFLHNSEVTPDSLRMRLSPVLTVLRQRSISAAPTSAPAVETSADAVDRLAKLAELLDRGLISREEFRG
jgi:hypothetical protein